jgi:hypothetical protein
MLADLDRHHDRIVTCEVTERRSKHQPGHQLRRDAAAADLHVLTPQSPVRIIQSNKPRSRLYATLRVLASPLRRSDIRACMTLKRDDKGQTIGRLHPLTLLPLGVMRDGLEPCFPLGIETRNVRFATTAFRRGRRVSGGLRSCQPQGGENALISVSGSTYLWPVGRCGGDRRLPPKA